MKKEAVININNNNKVINFEESKNKNSRLNKNLSKIIKEIFEISNDIEIKEVDDIRTVLIEEKIFCHFYLLNYLKPNKSKLKIIKDDIEYEYFISIENNQINISLDKIEIESPKLCGYILRYTGKEIININKDDKQIYIEFDEHSNSVEETMDTFNNINFEDQLSETYSKIARRTETKNIIIKKSIIVDKNYLQEIITDQLFIENGILIQYKSTVNKNNKTYVIEKNTNECIIKTFDGSIDSLSGVYFELNDQINFVKKLERKK